MKKILSLVLIIPLLFISLSTEASAYSYLGGKHKTKTLKVKQASSFLTTNQLIGGAFSSAMGDWNVAGTPIRISYNSTSLPNAEIIANGGYYGNTGWSGMCRNTRTYNYITKSNIQANYTYLLSKSYNFTKNKGVMAHEIGHALGLGHVSGSNKLMYNNDGRTVYKPTSDEINGIKALYK